MIVGLHAAYGEICTVKSKVIVFGVDGVRLDTLRYARTPFLDAVAAEGFLREVRVPDVNATWSGPCWSSVATGVLADVHGVVDNKIDGRLRDIPCFLQRASRAGLRTYAAAFWGPLLTDKAGGPIFRPDQAYVPPPSRGAHGGGDSHTDQLAADHAAKVLAVEDHDLALVYFGQVDTAGHDHGVSEAYVKALERVDTLVGHVRDAIASRATFDDEEWTCLVVTDHGHLDEGGHGGDTDVERTAWIAGCGPGAQAVDGQSLNHVDVPRLVLEPLGVA
ncbi:MAG: alkaline phosphatase family protein [Stackebrandtia sp.]